MTTEFRTLGFAAISWIEHYLVHGPGDVQGQSIDLDDELAAFTVKAYEVDAGGQRKVRRAFLSRSKGRNKSGFAAMLECFEALGPCRFDHWAEAGEVSAWGYEYDEGEPVGELLGYVEILNVATEEGQAGNTYDAVHYMLHPDTCSAELLAEFGKLDVGLTRINLPDKRGFIEPVTAANDSADGGKSTFIVADETHLWKLPRLKKMHQTMVRNLLKRRLASGWMLETSTMYAAGEGSVAEGTHAHAETLRRSGRNDTKLLFDHRQASMEWNLDSRPQRLKALREAYGPAAAWMDLQAIADYWDDPQASHAEFRRYWLNQPISTDETRPTSILPEWPACAVREADPPPVRAIGVAVTVDKEWASIAAAGTWSDDSPHIGAVDRREGSGWVYDRALAIRAEHDCVIVVDEKCPDATLVQALRAAGAVVIGAEQWIQACSDLESRVKTVGVTHMGHGELDDAVASAGWRYIGDRRVIGRKTGDADMLEAAALALHKVLHPVEVWGFTS